MEQSRSGKQITWPSLSHSTWTSTCFTRVSIFSMYRAGSLKLLLASRAAVVKAGFSSSMLSTKRMPLPPPPLRALINSGKPISSAAWRASCRSFTSSRPGMVGTPARATVFLAVSLLPIWRMTSAEGPTNLMPLSSHNSANSGFSDKKP